MVLHDVEDDPSASVCALEQRADIPNTTAHRILQRHEYRSHQVQCLESLLPRDSPGRVEFHNMMLEENRQDPQFLGKVLKSDETTCRKDGYINLALLAK